MTFGARSTARSTGALLTPRALAIAVLVAYLAWTWVQADSAGQLLNFTAIGIAEGAVFAIAASGLVLTYASTGVFNFAHGAVGMMGAFVYYELTEKHGVPTLLGLAIVLIGYTTVVGLGMEAVMRRFKDASAQTTIGITIGVTVILIGLAQRLFIGSGVALAARFSPLISGRPLDLGPAHPTRDNVLQLALAVLVAIGLRLLLFRSRVGAAMRAVVDNPDLADLNGVPSRRIARLSWVVGSFLATLAGVLVAAGAPLDPIVLTFAAVGAYGCAVVGRLRSIPMAFAGAIALGLIKNWGTFNVPEGQTWTSIRTAIPALFLFVALLLVPSARLSLGRVVSVKPPAVPGLAPSVVRGVFFVIGVVVVAQVVPVERLPDLTRALVFGLLLLSLVVLTGLSGQISLCQYAFMGIGAWAMAHIGGPWGIVLAGLAAIPLAFVVAVPTLRLQGLYLALATFGFATVSTYLVLNQHWIFGDGNLLVGRPHILGLDLTSDRAFMGLCGLVLGISSVAVVALQRGRVGRRLMALRDSQAACATVGVDVRRTKLLAFCLSAFIAGIAGALNGGLNGTAGTIQYDAINNIVLFLFAIVGGVTTVTGAVVGGALFAGLPYVQSEYPDQAGLVFVAIAVAAVNLGRQPNGIAGMLYGGIERMRTGLARPRGPMEVGVDALDDISGSASVTAA